MTITECHWGHLQKMSREIRNLSTCKIWQVRKNRQSCPWTQTRYSYVWQNHERSTCKRCRSSPQSQLLQHHYWRKFQKYPHSTEIRQLNAVYTVPSVPSKTEIFPRKLHDSLKPLILPPRLYIHIQKVLVLNTCHIVRNFLAE